MSALGVAPDRSYKISVTLNGKPVDTIEDLYAMPFFLGWDTKDILKYYVEVHGVTNFKSKRLMQALIRDGYVMEYNPSPVSYVSARLCGYDGYKWTEPLEMRLELGNAPRQIIFYGRAIKPSVISLSSWNDVFRKTIVNGIVVFHMLWQYNPDVLFIGLSREYLRRLFVPLKSFEECKCTMENWLRALFGVRR